MTLSRRSFVERALAVATAAAAGGRLRAAEPTGVAAKASGPNDRIRVAVVGFNGRGLSHIHAWLNNPGAELVAWCDCDPGVEAQAVKKFPNMPRQPRFEQDFRRLLEDRSIDVVSIATPNH